MLIRFNKDVMLTCGPCSWYSAGQGIVGEIVESHGDTLTIVSYSDGSDREFNAPKDSVSVEENIKTLHRPECCEKCSGDVGSMFFVKDGKKICWDCYMIEESGEFERYEYDPTTKQFIMTFKG